MNIFFNGTPVQLLMISILAHPLIEVELKIGIPDVVLGGGTIFLALCPLLKVVHSSKVLLQLHLLLPTLSLQECLSSAFFLFGLLEVKLHKNLIPLSYLLLSN